MKVLIATASIVATSLAVMGLTVGAQAEDGSSAVVSVLPDVEEVSYDGRWVRGPYGVILDRQTGELTEAETWGFVRDKPKLHLYFTRDPEAADWDYGEYYLVDVTSGVRKRIDTDSRGNPLKPSWTSSYDEEHASYYEFPQLLISNTSISRNGQKVAFCANYETPRKPRLYVKDLKTGRLTRTSVMCGVDTVHTTRMSRAPEMSDDGKVVHVNGDSLQTYLHSKKDHYWLADSLYFTNTGKSRKIKGWGSMTRDGGTIFMRIGVRPKGTKGLDPGRVGAYNVQTGKTVQLPGTNSIYGTDVYNFAAFDRASRRGRYVVSDSAVIDRTYNITTDINAILRSKGYLPEGTDCTSEGQFISGDGKVVLTKPCGSGYVAVTGWEPMAKVTVTPRADQSQLVVDVDPDVGSGYWTLRVQLRQPDGSWQDLPTRYRTEGSAETRTIDLGAGTYRVLVDPKYGLRAGASPEVTLTS